MKKVTEHLPIPSISSDSKSPAIDLVSLCETMKWSNAVICIGRQTPLATAIREINDLPSTLSDFAEQRLVLIRLQSTNSASFFESLAIEVVNRWERAVRSLERLDAVTIVEVSGPCGGLALDLILACDYRLATADFRLELPLCDGRLWPGMGLYRLAQQIGLAHTRRLLLSKDPLSHERCVELGLIDMIDVWPLDLPHRPNRHGARDLAIRRRLLLEALSTSYEDALGTHLAACDRELRQRNEVHHVRPETD